MIGYCRDRDLLSTIVILFLIGGSGLFFADMNDFPLKMIFAGAEDTDIVILLAILLGLLMSTSQSLLLILKSKFLVRSVNFVICKFCISNMHPLDRTCTYNLPLVKNIRFCNPSIFVRYKHI